MPPRPRGRGGDGDGTTSRPRSRVGTSAPTVRQAQESVAQAVQRGRPGIGHNSGRTLPADRRGDLPPGYTRDADGQVRGPDGRFAHDPLHVPPTRFRDTEYPSGYRQSTHDAMASRWTDQGRAQGGVPVDASGRRIPPEQLTWRDQQGRVIPYDQLTYDHRPPVVSHWNGDGYNMSRADRNDWYNDPRHLTPMTRSANSSAGGAMTERYRQDIGSDYSR